MPDAICTFSAVPCCGPPRRPAASARCAIRSAHARGCFDRRRKIAERGLQLVGVKRRESFDGDPHGQPAHEYGVLPVAAPAKVSVIPFLPRSQGRWCRARGSRSCAAVTSPQERYRRRRRSRRFRRRRAVAFSCATAVWTAAACALVTETGFAFEACALSVVGTGFAAPAARRHSRRSWAQARRRRRACRRESRDSRNRHRSRTRTPFLSLRSARPHSSPRARKALERRKVG